MTKRYFIATVALGILAAPAAQAQLLGGGGGLGGNLGGTLGGTLSGPMGSLRDLPSETLRSTTRGSARGDARTAGNQRVDRRSGSVAADRSVAGSVDAAGAQLVDTPAGSGTIGGSGGGSAGGSGNASAQLIGTDAVRDVTGRSVGRARDAVATTRQRSEGLAESARTLTGSASGSGNASGQGGGTLGTGGLVAAGSGMAAGDGVFAVTPGMPVLTQGGERFGKVRQIITDSRGRVTEVLVRAKDSDVTIPASSLSGSTSGLVMGETAASARDQDGTQN